jgi:hypothetical protein
LGFCSTIAKFDFCGGQYLPVLFEDIDNDFIPERIGGGFKLYNEPFEFDLKPGGPLLYEDVISSSDVLIDGELDTRQKKNQYVANNYWSKNMKGVGDNKSRIRPRILGAVLFYEFLEFMRTLYIMFTSCPTATSLIIIMVALYIALEIEHTLRIIPLCFMIILSYALQRDPQERG